MCTTEYLIYLPYTQDYLGDSVVKNLPASVGDSWDVGSIPGSGRYPGVGNSNLLRYSCLNNSVEPGRLHPLGSQRVGYDWVCARAYTHTHHTVDPLHLFCPWITFPTGNHYSALSVSLFLFYFVCWIFFFCLFQISHMSKTIQYLSLTNFT